MRKKKNFDKLRADIQEVKPSDHNWYAFASSGDDAVFAEYVYYQDNPDKTLSAEQKALFNSMQDQIPQGYQILLESDKQEDLKGNAFRSVVFLDTKKQEIIIATAGTILDHTVSSAKSDLYDDLRLSSGKLPLKMQQMEALIDQVIFNLGDDITEYKTKFVGHSLGAVMSNLGAITMDTKLRQRGLRKLDRKGKGIKDQISAVTFENPGLPDKAKEIYTSIGCPEDTYKEMNLAVFNNRENVINNLHPQIGDVYEIDPSPQSKRTHTPFQKFAKYLCDIMPTWNAFWFAKKICYFLYMGHNNAFLASEHSTSNFIETFKNKKGIVKGTGNNKDTVFLPTEDTRKVDTFDAELCVMLKAIKMERTDALDVMQDKHLGSQEYVMYEYNNDNKVVMELSYSQAERDEAKKELKQQQLEKREYKLKKELKNITKQKQQNKDIHKKLPKTYTSKIKKASAEIPKRKRSLSDQVKKSKSNIQKGR